MNFINLTVFNSKNIYLKLDTYYFIIIKHILIWAQFPQITSFYVSAIKKLFMRKEPMIAQRMDLLNPRIKYGMSTSLQPPLKLKAKRMCQNNKQFMILHPRNKN